MFSTRRINLAYLKNYQLGGVSEVEIMVFTNQLSVALKSGIALLDALEMLAAQASGTFKDVILAIIETVSDGKPLSLALKKQSGYFSPLYINMVKLGEMSGTLQPNLARLAIELKKSVAIKKKIRSAMIYPILVLVAVGGLGISMAWFVLPKVVPLFQSLEVTLPRSTQLLIFLEAWLKQYGSILLIVTSLLVVTMWFVNRIKAVKPYSHALFLKLPVVKNIIIKINLERFNRTLGTLLAAGMSVDESLKITMHVMPHFSYKKGIQRMMQQIVNGKSLQSAIDDLPHLFPPLARRMYGVAEKTGSLTSTLHYLEEYYEQEVDEVVKNFATTIEPLLLMCIGLVVGFVAVAILSPIYEITGNVSV